MPLTETDNYRLSDLIGIIVRWRRLGLYVFAAILIPGVLVTMLMPPLFKATATILIDRQTMAPAYSVKSGQVIESSTVMRSVNHDEEIKTVAETVKTRAIIEPVIAQFELSRDKLKYIHDFRRYVRMTIDGVIDAAHWIYNEFKYTLGLAKRPTPEEKAFLEHEDLIDDVKDRVDITPIPDTNVLQASFESSDAELAQKVINAIITGFNGTQPRADKTSQDFFATKKAQVEQELRDAQSRLAQFQEQTSTYSAATQRDLLLQAIERFRSDQTQTSAQRAQKEAAVQTLRGQLQTEPQFRKEITKSLLDAEVELAGLSAQQKTLEEAVTARLDALAKLNDAEVRAKDLDRQVALSEEAYNLNLRNFEQARATEGMAQAQLADVRIVDFASYPLSPVRPRTWLYLGIALGAAVLAGLGAPFLAHINDTTLATDRDVSLLLDIPFVATVPRFKTERERKPSFLDMLPPAWRVRIQRWIGAPEAEIGGAAPLAAERGRVG